MNKRLKIKPKKKVDIGQFGIIGHDILKTILQYFVYSSERSVTRVCKTFNVIFSAITAERTCLVFKGTQIIRKGDVLYDIVQPMKSYFTGRTLNPRWLREYTKFSTIQIHDYMTYRESMGFLDVTDLK